MDFVKTEIQDIKAHSAGSNKKTLLAFRPTEYLAEINLNSLATDIDKNLSSVILPPNKRQELEVK